ncbi:Methyltransferase type 11 [Candidatus Paraburkholderia schumanniana]|nr:Methyltransferase type 11 [Candidatus Paraburkholderia schumannianae]
MDNIFALWTKGIDSERGFWTRWFETKGLEWPDDYTERVRARRELDPWLQKVLRQSAVNAPGQDGMPRFRVLDVGAGPLSKIGNFMPDANLEVVAADPLAFIYSDLIDRHGITPGVRTQFAPAEDLSVFFAPSSFDLVHCSNALDHSFEPLRGIIEMLRVVRVGGTIILGHARNEAENEKYEGFHQHNFDVEDGRFVIWNKQERVIVEHELPVEFEIENSMQNHYVTNKIIKRSEFRDKDDNRRRDERLRKIYEQVIRAMSEK